MRLEDDEPETDDGDDAPRPPTPKEGDSGVRGFKLLEKTRTLMLGATVDGESVKRLAEGLIILEAMDPDAPVNLIINSYGGHESTAFAAYDLIRYVRPPVRCIATGVAGGVAALVYCAAPKERRFATPSTAFLLHQPFSGSFGAASDIELAAAELAKVRHRVLNVLSEACGQSVERLERDTRRKLTLDTEEARAYGLVGKIITSRSELV
jgi:ATP-dependent Clp protease protease subunit